MMSTESAVIGACPERVATNGRNSLSTGSASHSSLRVPGRCPGLCLLLPFRQWEEVDNGSL